MLFHRLAPGLPATSRKPSADGQRGWRAAPDPAWGDGLRSREPTDCSRGQRLTLVLALNKTWRPSLYGEFYNHVEYCFTTFHYQPEAYCPTFHNLVSRRTLRSSTTLRMRSWRPRRRASGCGLPGRHRVVHLRPGSCKVLL